MIFSYCNTVVRVLKMAEGYFKTLPENWGEDRKKKDQTTTTTTKNQPKTILLEIPVGDQS